MCYESTDFSIDIDPTFLLPKADLKMHNHQYHSIRCWPKCYDWMIFKDTVTAFYIFTFFLLWTWTKYWFAVPFLTMADSEFSNIMNQSKNQSKNPLLLPVYIISGQKTQPTKRNFTPGILHSVVIHISVSSPDQLHNIRARSGLILGLHPANERRGYKVKPYLIGREQTQKQPCRLYNTKK